MRGPIALAPVHVDFVKVTRQAQLDLLSDLETACLDASRSE